MPERVAVECRRCPYERQLCARAGGCTPFPDGLQWVALEMIARLVNECPDARARLHLAAYYQGPPGVRNFTACDHCYGSLRQVNLSGPRRKVCGHCSCSWLDSHPHQRVLWGHGKKCPPARAAAGEKPAPVV